ncbi:hypothetical protein LDENG_00251020 [Lucifuga dentata]|nr:hypothetical protein LDENG_00251020 [Lucifuga dentata]
MILFLADIKVISVMKHGLVWLQGNGHERDFLDDERVFIMDVYNRYIYPGDGFAKRAIKRKVELDWGTEDSEYLQKVELHCEGALNELRPDIIIYNAGTDILDGDPLGGLSISPEVPPIPLSDHKTKSLELTIYITCLMSRL